MKYEREYRKSLGFTNQESLKKHFKATDVLAINWTKLELYNERLKDICTIVNNAIYSKTRVSDIDGLTENVDDVFRILKKNDLFPHLNNQGRNPEDVYYNWMRGYVLCELFVPSLCYIFSIDEDMISHIGKDDLSKPETFSRSSTADLQITNQNQEKIRLEIQGGFTGKNDIKASKINEAISNYSRGIKTYIIHIDVFNGKAAFIDISNPNPSRLKYKKNSQFEGSKTIKISPRWFKWKLTRKPSSIDKLLVVI